MYNLSNEDKIKYPSFLCTAQIYYRTFVLLIKSPDPLNQQLENLDAQSKMLSTLRKTEETQNSENSKKWNYSCLRSANLF